MELTNPAAATWYIMLRAYQAYSNVTLKATYGVNVVANNFASDPDCVALWRFEPGKLTVDSIGLNTLTNSGVEADTTNFREGAGSGAWEKVKSDEMSIADALLDAGFPLKNGDPVKKMSLTLWFNAGDLSGLLVVGRAILSKHDFGKNSFMLTVAEVDGTYRVRFSIGVNSGTNWEHLTDSTTAIVPGQWYHVGVTYDNTDKSYRIRIYDATADAVAEKVGKSSNNIHAGDGTLYAGRLQYPGSDWDGLIDECAVFKDVLTASEIDQIRQKVYGKP